MAHRCDGTVIREVSGYEGGDLVWRGMTRQETFFMLLFFDAGLGFVQDCVLRRGVNLMSILVRPVGGRGRGAPGFV